MVTANVSTARAGGLCLVAAGISQILLRFLANQAGWYLGALPGINTIQYSGHLTVAITTASTIITALVWLGLGIAVVSAARRHLRILALVGLLAVLVLMVVPGLEQAAQMVIRSIALPSLRLGASLWLAPVLYALALICLVALARPAGPPRRVKPWTVILLVAALVSAVGNMVYIVLRVGGREFEGVVLVGIASTLLSLVPAVLFTGGWVLVAVAAKPGAPTTDTAPVGPATPGHPTSLPGESY